MEDLWLESDETGDEDDERINRSLDEATFEPEETVERQSDFEVSEAIELVFVQLMDGTDLNSGETSEIDQLAGRQEGIENLPVGRVAKIDSFTWKLQVAKDEVGDFRVPSLHGEPTVDGPDPGAPDPTGQPIDATVEPISDDGEKEPGMGWRDIDEAANIVLGAAAEDVHQDLEEYQAKQDAMNEAKQKIREKLGSQSSVELADGRQSETMAQLEEMTEPQVRYGEAESEPQDRADPASSETGQEQSSPSDRNHESAKDEARD